MKQTLALLRGEFPSFLAAINRGMYAFWLGSGISREKLDAVPVFVLTVLKHLQSRGDPSDLNDPCWDPFKEALALAALSKAEKEEIDFSRDIDLWSVRDAIISRVSSRYSDLLDIHIEGEPPDYLLWDVLKVPQSYGAGVADPDLEHYCLAVLMMEGVAPEIVTANWDGLIEMAVEELAPGNESVVSVYVRAADFRQPRGRSRLLKFHGCAVRAIRDPTEYRGLLVGRRTQITDWPHDPEHAAMRQEMTTLGTSHPTLMIGLSAQDSNIQDLFSAAKNVLDWNWPIDPSAFVFAEEELGTYQKNILRVGYGASFHGSETFIAQASHVRAFAKPLLSALMIDTWSMKLEKLALLTRTGVDSSSASKVSAGIATLSSAAASSVDTNMVASTRRLISDIGRAIALTRSGTNPSVPGSYMPIGAVPVHQMGDDPSLAESGFPEVAMALSIIGNNLAEGSMSLASTYEAQNALRPVLTTESGGISSRVFFAANSRAAVELALNGFVDEGDPSAVVVHSVAPPHRVQRAPSSSLGRTGQRRARHIDMSELLLACSSYDELQQGFREEFAL
ncbi:SIR2_2 domain-containing protein [Agreia sp. COWG]|nr:SIR2_2 domain-containing protein [Agreia sp. COWG]